MNDKPWLIRPVLTVSPLGFIGYILLARLVEAIATLAIVYLGAA